MLIRSLVALSLSAVVLAGCGDDKPSAGPATTPAPAASTPATTPAAAEVATVTKAEAKAKAKKKKAEAENAPEWVNAVNDRCKEYQEQSTKALLKFQKSGATSPAAAAEAMQQVLPLGQQMIAELRPVDVPANVQDDWDAFLDTLDGAFDLMPKITESVANGTPDPKLMEQFAEIEKKTRPFADEHGLSECLTS